MKKIKDNDGNVRPYKPPHEKKEEMKAPAVGKKRYNPTMIEDLDGDKHMKKD